MGVDGIGGQTAEQVGTGGRGKSTKNGGRSKPLDESTDDAAHPPSVRRESNPNQAAQRVAASGNLF